MKIKIESAWKSLCDAFPKLKDNPLYKGWYISYAILDVIYFNGSCGEP